MDDRWMKKDSRYRDFSCEYGINSDLTCCCCKSTQLVFSSCFWFYTKKNDDASSKTVITALSITRTLYSRFIHSLHTRVCIVQCVCSMLLLSSFNIRFVIALCCCIISTTTFVHVNPLPQDDDDKLLLSPIQHEQPPPPSTTQKKSSTDAAADSTVICKRQHDDDARRIDADSSYSTHQTLNRLEMIESDEDGIVPILSSFSPFFSHWSSSRIIQTSNINIMPFILIIDWVSKRIIS